MGEWRRGQVSATEGRVHPIPQSLSWLWLQARLERGGSCIPPHPGGCLEKSPHCGRVGEEPHGSLVILLPLSGAEVTPPTLASPPVAELAGSQPSSHKGFSRRVQGVHVRSALSMALSEAALATQAIDGPALGHR